MLMVDLNVSTLGGHVMELWESAGWLAAVFAVDYIGVLMAVLADMRSGVAMCRRKGIQLRSRGFRATVDKAGRYYLGLFAMSAIDCMIAVAVTCVRSYTGWSLPPLPLFTTLGAVGIGCIELKSIMENNHGRAKVKDAERKLKELLSDPEVKKIAMKLMGIED